MKRLHPSAGAALLAAALVLSPTDAWTIECKTPREWQPRIRQTPMDANGDFIHDALDAFGDGELVDVVVDLNRCPEPDDLVRLGSFGQVSFVSRWLSYVVMKQVLRGDVDALVDDPIVAFVEHDREIYLALDNSNPAVKVKTSVDYGPNTVHDQYPGLRGAGVNVAIIDTGVDDHLHESLLGKFVGGSDCTVDPCVDGNPMDYDGHGTGVAAVAVGSGGAPGFIQGIAPEANLVDISATAILDSVLRALDKVLDKKDDWNISVVNLSFSGCDASNGTDAWSEKANRMVEEGLIVVTAAGNCGNCSPFQEPCTFVAGPGAGDLVISVGASDERNTVDRADDGMSSNSMEGPRASDGDGDPEDEQKPDLAAPGTDITTADAGTTNQYGTILGGSTSLASPHVAGCAALLRQANPAITPLSAKELLLQTAEDRGPADWDASWGHGLLDCFAAVDELNAQLKTDLAYTASCGGGGPPCWLHPSLYPANPSIKEGIENTIIAEIENHGPNAAPSFAVKLSVFNFGNGDLRYDICTETVGGLLPGATTSVSCPWTPSISGTPPGSVHACLKAEIIYPLDSTFSNNRAQHNVNIEQTSSPAMLPMEVGNKTDEPLVMSLQGGWDCGGGTCLGWAFGFSETGFLMQPEDCPRNVDVVLNPINPEAVREARLNVSVLGFPEIGPPIDQGGAAVHARIGCVVTDLEFLNQKTLRWAGEATFLECPSVFDVARGNLPIAPYPSLTSRGDFVGAECIVDDTVAVVAKDSVLPDLGAGFYYLVRAGGPLTGTWDNGGQVGSRDDTLAGCP